MNVSMYVLQDCSHFYHFIIFMMMTQLRLLMHSIQPFYNNLKIEPIYIYILFNTNP